MLLYKKCVANSKVWTFLIVQTMALLTKNFTEGAVHVHSQNL